MRPLLKICLLLALSAGLGCPGARPGSLPTPTPSGVPHGTTGVVEGSVRRSPDGDVYRDDRFNFSVRGPAGWSAQLNFPDVATRVVFQEPSGRLEQACRIAIRMGDDAARTSATWNEADLNAALARRGEVFYLDRLEHALEIDGTVWTATLYTPDGRRAELGFFFLWLGNRAEVVGSFPVDRVSSCKTPLDDVIATLVDS